MRSGGWNATVPGEGTAESTTRATDQRGSSPQDLPGDPVGLTFDVQMNEQRAAPAAGDRHRLNERRGELLMLSKACVQRLAGLSDRLRQTGEGKVGKGGTKPAGPASGERWPFQVDN